MTSRACFLRASGRRATPIRPWPTTPEGASTSRWLRLQPPSPSTIRWVLCVAPPDGVSSANTSWRFQKLWLKTVDPLGGIGRLIKAVFSLRFPSTKNRQPCALQLCGDWFSWRNHRGVVLVIRRPQQDLRAGTPVEREVCQGFLLQFPLGNANKHIYFMDVSCALPCALTCTQASLPLSSPQPFLFLHIDEKRKT